MRVRSAHGNCNRSVGWAQIVCGAEAEAAPFQSRATTSERLRPKTWTQHLEPTIWTQHLEPTIWTQHLEPRPAFRRFRFGRKIRIVRCEGFAVRFPCHDKQCHTHCGKSIGDVCISTQTGDSDRVVKRVKGRPALEGRGRARCPARWRIRFCGFEHGGVLPAVVCGAAAAARECSLLRQAGTGRAGGISSLPAVQAEVVQRKFGVGRDEGNLPVHRAAS